MNIGKVIGKSILKAGKYVGLTAAGAAVAGVAGVFQPETLATLLELSLNDPKLTLLIPLIAQVGGGAVGPVLAIAIQQIYKHRDKI